MIGDIRDLETAEIHGSSLESGLPYELVGESEGFFSGRSRLVTEDDFRLLAQKDPGLDIDRASAGPHYTIVLGITLSGDNAIEAVLPESVSTDADCL